MGKGKEKRGTKTEPATMRPTVPDFTKSRVVKKQVSVLAKLTHWQKKSAETDWVIGEYLDTP